MHVTVHLVEEMTTSLSEPFFRRIAEETLKCCGLPAVQQKKRVMLNAVSISQDRIRALNSEYRKKDQVTDILSFGEYTDTDSLVHETGEELFLGELFWCEAVIAEAAQEDAVTLEHEMVYVFSHGVLHLLGYDHSDEMFAIQDTVTANLMEKTNIKNI